MGFSPFIIHEGPDAFYFLEWGKAVWDEFFGDGGDSPQVGHLDSEATKEAYSAGCALSEGIPLDTVMNTYGLKMLEPGMRAEKEWPSYETTHEGLYLLDDAMEVMEELIQ
jgi:hypothetical protein